MLSALTHPDHLQAVVLTALVACWALCLPFLAHAERVARRHTETDQ
jgi:hypothetical protein